MTTFAIETEQESDGRWIGEIATLPGALAYGATREEAERNVLDVARELEFEQQLSRSTVLTDYIGML